MPEMTFIAALDNLPGHRLRRSGKAAARVLRTAEIPLLVVEELGKLGIDAVVQAEFEGGVEMVRQALIRYPADKESTTRPGAGYTDTPCTQS